MGKGIAAVILQWAKEGIGIGYIAGSGEIAGVVAIQVIAFGADDASTIAAGQAVGHNAVGEGQLGRCWRYRRRPSCPNCR